MDAGWAWRLDNETTSHRRGIHIAHSAITRMLRRKNFFFVSSPQQYAIFAGVMSGFPEPSQDFIGHAFARL
jgi:hypothetical protein